MSFGYWALRAKGVRRLTRAQKIAYSFGSFAAAVPYQAFSAYILFFYVDTLKLSPAEAGVVMALYGIWNAINDPLLGQLSDRTRTRWGRRIPYIAFGTLPLLLVFMLVWLPPFSVEAGQGTALLAWFVTVIFLFDGLYTLVILNWTALFPEMFDSLEERAEVSAWRQLFGVLGLIVGIAATPLLYGSIGWGWMGAIYAALTGVALGISLLGSQEKRERDASESLAVIPAIRYTLGNWSFVSFGIGHFLIQVGLVTLTAVVPFYAKYVLRVADTQTSVLMGAIFIVAIAVLYPWKVFTIRVGVRNAMIAACVLFGLSATPFWFADSFAEGVATTALMGIGLAGVIVLTDLMIADIVDEDEIRTGVRREGMYFGVNALFIRLAVSVESIIVGWVFTRTGYNADLVAQPGPAITGLRLLVTAVPLASFALAAMMFYLYPLHGKRLGEIKAALARVRSGQPSE